jgi:hypothetical protein
MHRHVISMSWSFSRAWSLGDESRLRPSGVSGGTVQAATSASTSRKRRLAEPGGPDRLAEAPACGAWRPRPSRGSACLRSLAAPFPSRKRPLAEPGGPDRLAEAPAYGTWRPRPPRVSACLRSLGPRPRGSREPALRDTRASWRGAAAMEGLRA